MKNLTFILLAAIALMSCKGNTSDSSQSSASGSQSPVTASVTKGKYAFRSGILEYKIEMMGMGGTQTIYFEDFGNKETSEIVLDVMGTKTKTMTISKDGTIYTIDPARKTGSKTSLGANANINFEALNDEVIKEWNLKKVGRESVIGKDCDKYSMENEAFAMKGFYWIYKGVSLKVDAMMSTAKIKMDATSFQENASIPPEKFEVPADIVFN